MGMYLLLHVKKQKTLEILMDEQLKLVPFTDNCLKDIQHLEESLWRADTRYDRNFQEKRFAPDFFEFGRSGRTYEREQMIRTEQSEIRATLPLKNFKVRKIDECTILVTYVSEVQYDSLERGNRSSLWSMFDDGWKLRFHQGTPIFD